MKKIILVCYTVCTFFSARAQQVLEWNIHTFGFADNREYAKANLYDQSILGIRVAPEIGFSIDSTHRVRFGVNFLQEFGAKPFGAKVNPIAYYNYEHAGISFYIGAFPRLNLVDVTTTPRALLTDTMMYYRPNLEGLFFRYKKAHFNEQIWVDWTSRQTRVDREQFMVGFSGTVEAKRFFFSHYFKMLHTANTMDGGYPVRDNNAALAEVGMNLSGTWGLDSLTIGAGGLASMDRIRGVYDTQNALGFISDVHAAYKAWFVHNTFYKGDEQTILFGDQFYTKDTYDRVDLGWRPFRKGPVEGFFMFSLHFTPGTVTNQQMIQLRYNIGRGHRI